MSAEQLNAFWEAVQADEGLQEKLKGAGGADAVVAIAKETGFAISAEAVENHLKEKLEESDDVVLTAEQLEAVAGGAYSLRPEPKNPKIIISPYS